MVVVVVVAKVVVNLKTWMLYKSLILRDIDVKCTHRESDDIIKTMIVIIKSVFTKIYFSMYVYVSALCMSILIAILTIAALDNDYSCVCFLASCIKNEAILGSSSFTLMS